MCETPQVRAIQLDGEQVPIWLKLVRQANLLSRIASKVACEHDALQVCREFGMVCKAAMGVKDLAQSAAIRPHLQVAPSLTRTTDLYRWFRGSLRNVQQADPCSPMQCMVQD